MRERHLQRRRSTENRARLRRRDRHAEPGPQHDPAFIGKPEQQQRERQVPPAREIRIAAPIADDGHQHGGDRECEGVLAQTHDFD
jgi:hypothetical protein